MLHKIIKPYIKPSKDNYSLNAEFNYQLVFINETSTDITVVMRDNLAIPYPRQPQMGASSNQTFTIRKIYNFNSNYIIQEIINNIFLLSNNEKDPTIVDDIYYIQKELQDLVKYNPYCRMHSISIDRTISLKEITELDCFYLTDVDVMIYHGRYSKSMLHPYSWKAKSLNMFEEIKSDNIASGVLMEIVTSENTIKSRYVHIGGQIMKIPINIDINRPEGLYVSRINDDQVTSEFCSLNEMQDKYGVYPTEEEALTAGQPDIIYKTRLKELEKEVELTKRQSQKDSFELKQTSEKELSDLKLNHEREKSQLEMQREKERIEHERNVNQLKRDQEEFLAEMKKEAAKQKQEMDERLHALEEKRQEMKDHYEKRSHERKDSSELIKFVPALLLAGIGIYGIATKGK